MLLHLQQQIAPTKHFREKRSVLNFSELLD